MIIEFCCRRTPMLSFLYVTFEIRFVLCFSSLRYPLLRLDLKLSLQKATPIINTFKLNER